VTTTARWARALLPLATTVVLLLWPAPDGLAPHAWRFAAVFAGVIVALVTEPLPGGAVGLVGVTTVALLARWMLFGPDDLARDGFDAGQGAVAWALSGFANPTVWLIFGAFMFARGYERTGLGRRLALRLVQQSRGHALALGYAITLADLLLAPFTPSNTARSGGTIFPVIRHLPPLYGSLPFDPSARRIGSYLMWVAIASTCVTSSMFLTGLATNLLAIELVTATTGLRITWTTWVVGFAPVGLLLLAAVPLFTFWCYRPQVTSGADLVPWARSQLAELGPVRRGELLLGGLVALALAAWIAGGTVVSATTVALAVVSVMVLTGILSWDDVIGHAAAWNTLVWFATLVAMADGLRRTGVLAWCAAVAARHVGGLDPGVATVALLSAFFVAHYLFASSTAHAAALLPPTLAVAAGIPGVDLPRVALLLCFSFGLMGVLTPYATGPSPIYFGSGYLPARDYWRLGALFGAVYLLTLLLVGMPWVFAIAM
jgi:L-tartrate/succinate antiporter